MCLIVFAWKASSAHELIVAANRDEWHARPTAPAQWWPSDPIFAGRDLQAGGTWLGVTRSGRFAALTNFRDPSEKKSNAPSRGELVTQFLRSDETPEAFLSALSKHASDYAGFNLLCADRNAMGYLTSPTATMQILPAGIYALSNGVLDAPWPKALQARSRISKLLHKEMPEDARGIRRFTALPEDAHGIRRFSALADDLFGIMNDTSIAADDVLPSTGVGLEWERRLSAIKIVSPDYGTRCTTVLAHDTRGRTHFAERSFDASGDVTHEVQERI